MQVVIWSNSHKEMLEWIHAYGKVPKYTQPFFYEQRIFWKEIVSDRVKVLESNVLKLLFEDNNGWFA